MDATSRCYRCLQTALALAKNQGRLQFDGGLGDGGASTVCAAVVMAGCPGYGSESQTKKNQISSVAVQKGRS
jgi:hypothetical protein